MSACQPLLAAWLANVAWVLAWSVLGALSVFLVVLLRTRWQDAKPWKKCAILSLWVHVLLACLTAMVRIASHGPGYGPGYGPGESIRVFILPAELAAADETDAANDEADPRAEVETPPAEDATTIAATEVVDSETTKAPPDNELAPVEPALDAPTLLAEPTPVEPAEPEPAATPVASALADESPVFTPTPTTAAVVPLADAIVLEAEDAVKLPADLASPPAPVAAVVPSPAVSLGAIAAAAAAPSAAASPTSASPSSARPTAYAPRFAANRAQLVAAGGGNGQTEAAVHAALAWLAAAQSDDGRWDAKRHGAGREIYSVLGQDRGSTGAKADSGVGGLALLALLGAGHTHREGDYAEHVSRGLAHLRQIQRPDGDLGGEAEFFARMYCHSMATFAAAEAFALTRDDALRSVVDRGVGYSLQSQHQVDGGWRYVPGQQGDTSQLGWQLMALKSARQGEVAVPEVTWTRMERFLRHVERGHAGGLAAYQPAGPPTRSMTAEALYCRQLLAGRGDGGLSRAALAEAVNSLLTEPPTPERVNLYYWYYATLALHQAQHATPEATAAWRQWNEALIRTLVATQSADGSWPANCLWGGYGGRVYTTSLACLSLEVYYRYAPPAGGENVAQRSQWQAVPR